MQKIVLVGGGILTAFLLMEIAARLIGIPPYYGNLMPLEGVPTRTVEGVELWSSKHPRASAEEIQRAASNHGAFLIVGLGDSIMYGYSGPGSTEDDTYLEQARRLLARRSSRPVEIINLAVPGYNTRQEDAAYKERENELRPNLVIVHYWINDARQYRVVGGYVVDYGDVSDDGRFVVRALPLPPRLSDFLLLHLRLYDLLTHWVVERHRAAEPTDWDEVVGQPLASIDARVRRAGGRLLILASPDLTGTSPRPIVDLPALRRFAEPRGIEVIDVSQWLAGVASAEVVLDDRVHFNPEGHRIVGERLADYLLQHDLKPRT